jgi:hypothetical protein
MFDFGADHVGQCMTAHRMVVLGALFVVTVISGFT